MAWVDLLILVAAGYGVFKGIRTGAVRQIVGFAGFFVALLLATALMDEVGAMLVASFSISPRISTLVGFGVTMIGALLVLGILTRVLEKTIEAAKLGVVNRGVGGAVGMVRSLLVVSAVLVPLRTIGVPRADVREASPFYAPVAALLPFVWDHTGGLVDEGWRLRDRIDALVDMPGRPDSLAAPPASRPPTGAETAPAPRRPAPRTRTVE